MNWLIFLVRNIYYIKLPYSDASVLLMLDYLNGRYISTNPII